MNIKQFNTLGRSHPEFSPGGLPRSATLTKHLKGDIVEAIMFGKIDYPVTVKHWHGHSREIIDSAERWAMQWQQSFLEDAGNISANIFACCDNEQDEVQLYFVPRDQTRAFSSEMSGMIGGLEILGELVFSKEEEKQTYLG